MVRWVRFLEKLDLSAVGEVVRLCEYVDSFIWALQAEVLRRESLGQPTGLLSSEVAPYIMCHHGPLDRPPPRTHTHTLTPGPLRWRNWAASCEGCRALVFFTWKDKAWALCLSLTTTSSRKQTQYSFIELLSTSSNPVLIRTTRLSFCIR